MRHIVLIAALIATLAVSAPTSYSGSFALAGSRAKTSAHLVASQIGRSPLKQHLDMWFTQPRSSRPIRAYDIDMTQDLHLIVVSDDFRTFLHVHPILKSNGHFVLIQQFPRATGYHLYADADPHGIGQQVFRFDLNIGGETITSGIAATDATDDTGPYRVTISSNTFTLPDEAAITMHITQNGSPATNLHPYLGALAHAVFLQTSDLSYLHVHPVALGSSAGAMSDMPGMEMPSLPSSSVSSPDMQLHVAFREPGTYRLWLQFRGGSHVYVAPFAVTVRQP